MSRSRTKSGDAPHIYSHEYFQRLSGVAERHWWVLGMRAIAERLLDPHLRGRVGTRVLDAGSGTGGNLAWLQRYADPRHIVGIDYSSIALAFSETDARRRLAQASVMALPFADGRFDLVNCTDVIQHLPQDGADQRALQEFSRVLRPGGVALSADKRVHGGENRTGTRDSTGLVRLPAVYPGGAWRPVCRNGLGGGETELRQHAACAHHNLDPAVGLHRLPAIHPGHGSGAPHERPPRVAESRLEAVHVRRGVVSCGSRADPAVRAFINQPRPQGQPAITLPSVLPLRDPPRS